MSALEMFTGGEFSARVILVDSDPWFVASDVCACLGVGNPRDAVAALDDDEKGVATVDTLGGAQEVRIISEPGLYSIILRSRKPQAKAFKRWITHEVIPSIRRSGSYGVPEPRRELTNRELAQMVIEAEDAKDAAERARALAEAKVAELEPAIAAAETILLTGEDATLREAAQILSRAEGVMIGQNRLSKWLKSIGWISPDQRPYQKHVEAGRLTMVMVEWEHQSGEMRLTPKTLITPKGMLQLHRMLTSGRGPTD